MSRTAATATVIYAVGTGTVPCHTYKEGTVMTIICRPPVLRGCHQIKNVFLNCIQIQAFGGRRGDKGSDARRLSLKRALAIRQVLIDDGVAAERIDVRAMGGADDSGPADRVDVYIKA